MISYDFLFNHRLFFNDLKTSPNHRECIGQCHAGVQDANPNNTKTAAWRTTAYTTPTCLGRLAPEVSWLTFLGRLAPDVLWPTFLRRLDPGRSWPTFLGRLAPDVPWETCSGRPLVNVPWETCSRGSFVYLELVSPSPRKETHVTH